MSNESTPEDQTEDPRAETTAAHRGSVPTRRGDINQAPCSFDHAVMALRGRLGGRSTSARLRSEDMTAAARKSFLARFERQAREESMPHGSRWTGWVTGSLPILQKGR